MHLDTFTTLIGLSTVVSVLGLQLLFFWTRDRQSPWLAWFGCTFLLGAAAALSYLLPRPGHEFLVLGVGNALRIAAFGFLWNGTRLFGGRQPERLAVVFCLLVWLALCSVPQFLASMPLRIIGVSAFTALFCLLSAWELWRGRAEHLPSRMPSVAIFLSFALLVAVRMPLVGMTPFPFGALPLDPAWLAGFSLIVFLHAAFLAALMLQMTRERRELEQRHFALSDPLTGLFNRRAFHDQVAQPAKRRKGGHREALALLVLDLDHFKLSTIALDTMPATRCCSGSVWWLGPRPERSTGFTAWVAKSSASFCPALESMKRGALRNASVGASRRRSSRCRRIRFAPRSASALRSPSIRASISRGC